MKRLLTLALSLALLLTAMMLPATAETAELFARDENGYPNFEGKAFTVWAVNRKSSVTNDYGDFANVKKLEELFNCDIQFVHPPVGQERDNFAITMASDDLPDMFYCGSIDNYYPGGISMAYADGILYDYTELVNEVNTPNFSEIVMSDPYWAKAVYDDEGRIIRLGAKLCGGPEADFQFAGLTVRSDYLAATGLEMPETIADWHELLTAFKANGVEYPLLVSTGYDLSIFSQAWNIMADDFSLDADGNVVYGPYTEAFKDYLTEMNTWYNEGLINADYMNTSDDDAKEMLINDRGGSINIHFWNWEYVYIPTVEKEHPEKSLIGAQLPKLNEESSLTNLRSGGRGLGDYKYITVDAEDPAACVYLLDALYLEEISTMMGFGIEGVGWEDRGGFPFAFAIGDEETQEVKLQSWITEWHMYEDWDPDLILNYKYCTNGVPTAMRLMLDCGTDGRISKYIMLNTEEAETKADLNTDISTYVSEMTLKFITGNESLDNFGTYLEQLKALGIEDLIAIYQAAQDRFEAR